MQRNGELRNLILTCFCLLALAGGSLEAADFVRPTIPVTWRPGACDDGFMTPMKPFVRLGNRQIARRLTRPMFTHDAEMLRILVHAAEPDMAAVRLAFARERPERLRDDDSVSVYLRSDSTIHEFTVTADGRLDEVRWTGGRDDPGWTAGATWTITQPEEWMGLLTVPWSALGIEPAAGTRLDFAAVRRSRPNNEVSGWPACSSPTAVPEQWGTLLLRGADEPYIGQFIPSRLLPGDCSLTYWLKPDGTSGTVEVLAAAGAGPQPLPLTFKHRGHGGGWWSAAFAVPPGAPLRLQQIMRVNGEVLHATAVLPLPQPLLTRELAAAQARLRSVRDGAEAITDTGARTAFLQACARLDSEMGALIAEVRETTGAAPAAERTALLIRAAEHARRCSQRCSMLAGRAAALRANTAATGFGVGSTHSIRKLGRAETDLDYGQPLRLRAARRERESGQIVLIPFDTTLSDVRVTWTGLRGPGAADIAKDHVRIDLVGYVKTTAPDYEVERVGWWADPLLPLAPFDVSTDRTQPLWVTVFVPAGTPAGLYRGSIHIDAGAAGALAVPLEVRALGYDLPLAGRLRTIFGFDWNDQLVGWYRWDTPKFRPHEYKNIPQERARQIWDLTLSYRIYAGGLYEWLRFPRAEDLDFCLERGLNNYQIGLPEHDTLECIPRLRRICDELRARGLMDIVYVYAWDENAEAKPNSRRNMIEKWTALEQAIPDLTRANVYGNPDAEVMSVLDVVMPLTPELAHRERWNRWRDQGRITGAYICCGPLHPYANFFIDYPAIDQRVLFWQLYDYDVTFFLYYMINIWRQSDGNGARWPDADWVTATHGNDNGDGHLVYPGRNAVLPSVRLANIRDGIEDYEAFAVLDELTARLDPNRHQALIRANRELLQVPDEVTASLIETTKDPGVLLAARRRLDAQILAALDALPRPVPE